MNGVSSGDGGLLTVRRGELLLELGPVSRRFTGVDALRHAQADVRVVHARFFPPWSNVVVFVSDGDRTAGAVMPITRRKAMIEAIDKAGFAVHQTQTWFSLGSRGTRSG